MSLRFVDDIRCLPVEWQECKNRTDAEADLIKLPANWTEVRIPENSPAYGARAYHRRDGATVLLSAGRQEDGKWWLHVSMVLPRGLPTYWDLADLKSVFIGPERQALLIFPPKSKHINIHDRCLHLWCCLDGDGLPDFGRHGTI